MQTTVGTVINGSLEPIRTPACPSATRPRAPLDFAPQLLDWPLCSGRGTKRLAPRWLAGQNKSDHHSMRKFHVAVAMIATVVLASSAQAEDVELVRLPDDVIGRYTAFQGARGASAGREVSLGGWLVLNGASFSRDEFPELARHLDFDRYRRGAAVDVREEFVVLPEYPYEMFEGQVVEGMAICPMVECSVGRRLPFRVEGALPE